MRIDGLSTQHYAAKEQPEFVDLFSMYLERADEEDEKRANLWMANTDRVLLFVSARVTYRTSHDG